MGTSIEGKFNVGQGAVIERSDGKILLIKRAGKSDFNEGLWEVVYGRMKQFEEYEEEIRREVFEETGLQIDIVKPLRIFHFYRGAKTADNELYGASFWCRLRSGSVKLSPEHTEHRWIEPEEALKLPLASGIGEDIKQFLQEKHNLIKS